MAKFWTVDRVDELNVSRVQHRIPHDSARAENDRRWAITVGVIVLTEHLMLAQDVQLVRYT